MSGKRDDHDLGLHCNIDRRDFIHAVGLSLVAAGLPNATRAAAVTNKNSIQNYPPVKTGMRGAHPGSFETAHALAREGQTWPNPATLNEQYDLVIVGGGISGLAAAWLYRDRYGSDARVLIIDNHDDFGGHATRNEFHYNGNMLVAWGGAVNMEYPSYDRKMRRFLKDIGVDLQPLIERQEYYFGSVHGYKEGLYFDAEHYGEDKLIPVDNRWDIAGAFAKENVEYPISQASRNSLVALATGKSNLLSDMNGPERYEYLARTSYDHFLRDKGGLTTEARQLFTNYPLGNWGVGTDAVPAIELIADGWLGAGRVGRVPYINEFKGAKDMTMFPDGNASLARLMVRTLIPGAATGDNMMDIATSEFYYSKLDIPDNKIRLRLGATAVNIANRGQHDDVAITYVKDGKACKVFAPRCILACNNAIIPFLMPDLPETQKSALRKAVRTPLVITNVLLDNGRAIENLGISAAIAPARFNYSASLVGGLDLGSYQQGWDPDGPCVIQAFTAVPGLRDGSDRRSQFRVGRNILLGMSFADFEREIRIHFNGMFGAGGFDAARDIKAITVNRWPHGYAYEYSSYDDPEYGPGEAPHEIARKRVGRVAIANTDAEAKAYFNGGVESAMRAVRELAKI